MPSLSTIAAAAATAALAGSSERSGAIPPNIANITFLTAAAAKTGAVCLDGSPAAFYFRQEAETQKFYIHQQGGGWCESDSDCAGRANTALGSSKSYTATTNLGGGYFSNDPAQNPMMYNWSKVFLPYCDGGSQTGDLTAPVTVGKQTIYYRGHRILEAMIPTVLANTGAASATDVVISGCSAGGLSTFLHADSWAAALPSAKVVAMPDSGFFLDYNNTAEGSHAYGAALRWVYNRMNSTYGVPQACAKANPEDPAKCIFAEHVSVTLKTPTFPLQSEYDSWQEGNILFNNTPAALNAYGALLTSTLESNLLASNPNHGVMLDSCNHHCGEWGSITIDGQNQAQAFAQWYAQLGTAGAKKEWKQGQPFPCASCCKPTDDNGEAICTSAEQFYAGMM